MILTNSRSRKDDRVFQKNENQQMSITDSFNQLPEYLKDYLRKSWAHEFQNTIFPAINEERFPLFTVISLHGPILPSMLL